MDSGMYHRRADCRVCGAGDLEIFLSLGPTPLANACLASTDAFADEPSFPLDVAFCMRCSLVQTPDVINPETLFRHYLYVTGTSDTIAEHNRQYADTVVALLGLSPSDQVIEIASNDGSLLGCFQAHGVKTLGVEPATNIAERARAAGVETLDVFFDDHTAETIRASRGAARAVVANNVFAHVDDTLGFLKGCRKLLSDDGRVIIEVPYLGELLDQLEYDTIYHEHLCYFSVHALRAACDAAGLSMVRVDDVDVHGGSLRLYAGLPDHCGGHAAGVLERIEAEQREGLHELGRYQRFGRDVAEHRASLVEMLTGLRRDGKRLAAYGAPAKGNTLLNYCGIGSDLIEFTVDKNPLKVGSFTPGMHIPIENVGRLTETMPDYVLILAWNFADEIMRQQKPYRDRGGRFMIPIPVPKIV